MSEVGQHENITLLTYGEVEEVDGLVGNFTVHDPQEGALRERGEPAPAAGSASRSARRRSSTTSSRRASATARPSTAPSPRPCPSTRSSTSPHCTYFKSGKCKACQIFCPPSAIDFEQKDEMLRPRGRQHHPGHRLRPVRLPDGSRSTATAGWRTSSRASSSSGCATRPARPPARSSCATASRSRRRVAIIHCVGSRDTQPPTSTARRSAACRR